MTHELLPFPSRRERRPSVLGDYRVIFLPRIRMGLSPFRLGSEASCVHGEDAIEYQKFEDAAMQIYLDWSLHYF